MMQSKRTIGKTGLEVSELGIGGGPLGNLFRAVSDADAEAVLAGAAAGGVRLFDTAPFYGFGLSERRFGDGLRSLPRDGLVLSTKVGRLLKPLRGGAASRAPSAFASPMPFEGRFDYSYDGVMRSYEDSLQRLGLSRIDILLFHDLAGDTHNAEAYARHFRIAMESGLRAAEELRRSGDIAAIGLGVNFIEPCMSALAHGDFDVFLLASRLTLLEQATVAPLLAECARRKVSILAGAPFNSGILVTGARPGATYEHAPAPPEVMKRVRKLEEACSEHGLPLAAAALQFPLRCKQVAAVVPGVRNLAELNASLRWSAVPIAETFWSDLKERGLIVDV